MFLAQRSPDCGFGTAGDDHIFPAWLWSLAVGANNFNRLPVTKTCPQRHSLAINFCANATVADAGVDSIGKINRGRTTWQIDNRAFRGETEHLILKHLKLHMLKILIRILGVFKPVNKPTQPVKRVHRKRVFEALAITIGPVRSHAGFRHDMHFAGTDLDFNPLGITTRHCGLDRAIAVGLRLADVILESSRNRLPTLMYRA